MIPQTIYLSNIFLLGVFFFLHLYCSLCVTALFIPHFSRISPAGNGAAGKGWHRVRRGRPLQDPALGRARLRLCLQSRVAAGGRLLDLLLHAPVNERRDARKEAARAVRCGLFVFLTCDIHPFNVPFCVCAIVAVKLTFALRSSTGVSGWQRSCSLTACSATSSRAASRRCLRHRRRCAT